MLTLRCRVPSPSASNRKMKSQPGPDVEGGIWGLRWDFPTPTDGIVQDTRVSPGGGHGGDGYSNQRRAGWLPGVHPRRRHAGNLRADRAMAVMTMHQLATHHKNDGDQLPSTGPRASQAQELALRE
jgi:hypothetical protein